MIEYSLDSDYDENEVGLAEWTKNTKTVVCQWVKKKALVEGCDYDCWDSEVEIMNPKHKIENDEQ
jgi:hypothetical protein